MVSYSLLWLQGRLSKDNRTYQERLERATEAEQREHKRLLEEQRHMKASHDGNIGQRKMFLALRALVQAKLEATRKGNERSAAAAGLERGALDSFASSTL